MRCQIASGWLVLLLFMASTAAADWPQFRGEAGRGLADGAGHPESWSESENVAWTIDVPGAGWSAPIVTGGKVLLTTSVESPDNDDERTFELHCYRLTDGKLLWDRVATEGAPRQPTHRDNTFASETPVTDGERVYAYFGMTGLYCYDLDGQLLWSKDLGSYRMRNDWGTSSSPVVADGIVFVQVDNEDSSFVVALDAADGAERWRVERPDESSNWSTPLVWSNSVRTELVLSGKTIRSLDTTTGEQLWSMEIGGRSSATATAVGDVFYVGSENRSRRGGTPGGLFAVRAGAEGEIVIGDDSAEEHGLLWANPQGAIGIASPLVFDGQIYVATRRGGVLRVHDAATGDESYRKRLPGGGTFWASPWASGGRVYCLDERGKTFVLAPGSEYELLGESELSGRFWSSPAIADGTLLLRSAERLYAIREK